MASGQGGLRPIDSCQAISDEFLSQVMVVAGDHHCVPPLLSTTAKSVLPSSRDYHFASHSSIDGGQRQAVYLTYPFPLQVSHGLQKMQSAECVLMLS